MSMTRGVGVWARMTARSRTQSRAVARGRAAEGRGSLEIGPFWASRGAKGRVYRGDPPRPLAFLDFLPAHEVLNSRHQPG